MDVAARFIVSGRVQGVFFRGSTCEQAQRLDLRGYARNLDDGRVEVVACGPDAAVAQLADWLQRGPPAARVTSVERHVAQASGISDGFSIA